MNDWKSELSKVAAEMEAKEPETKVEPKVEPEKAPEKVETKAEPPVKESSKDVKTEVSTAPEASDEPLPDGWADDKRDSFKTLSPDLKKYLRDREAEQKKAFNAKVQDAEKIRKQYERYEPVSKVFEPIRQNLELNGVSEAQYVQRLLAAENFLRTNPKEALKWLAQQSNVQLSELVEAPTNTDPALESVNKKLAMVEQQLSQFTTGNQQAIQQNVQSTLEKFQNEADATGLKHPHFEKVRYAMGALLKEGIAKDMDDAYERAVYADPELRKASIEAQVKAVRDAEAKEQARLTAEAKAKAKTNISGSTPPDTKQDKPKSWKEALRQAEEQLST